MDKKKLAQCLNCQQALLNDENFCPNCGQKNHATRLSIRSLASDLINNVFNVDARLWVTLKTAVFKIGQLVKDFNAGKRKKYVAPVQFYLFCSLFYFLFLGIENQKFNDTTNDIIKENITSHDTIPLSLGVTIIKITQSEFQAIPDYSNQQIDSLLLQKKASVSLYNRLMLKQAVKILTDGTEGVSRQLISLSSTGMFLLVPIFGGLLFLFLKRIYPYYIEHLTFSVYLHAIIFLILSIDVFLRLIVDIPSVNLISILIVLVYTLVAIKRFYDLNWLKTIGYATLLGITYSFIFVIFITIISILSLLIV